MEKLVVFTFLVGLSCKNGQNLFRELGGSDEVKSSSDPSASDGAAAFPSEPGWTTTQQNKSKVPPLNDISVHASFNGISLQAVPNAHAHRQSQKDDSPSRANDNEQYPKGSRSFQKGLRSRPNANTFGANIFGSNAFGSNAFGSQSETENSAASHAHSFGIHGTAAQSSQAIHPVLKKRRLTMFEQRQHKQRRPRRSRHRPRSGNPKRKKGAPARNDSVDPDVVKPAPGDRPQTLVAKSTSVQHKAPRDASSLVKEAPAQSDTASPDDPKQLPGEAEAGPDPEKTGDKSEPDSDNSRNELERNAVTESSEKPLNQAGEEQPDPGNESNSTPGELPAVAATSSGGETIIESLEDKPRNVMDAIQPEQAQGAEGDSQGLDGKPDDSPKELSSPRGRGPRALPGKPWFSRKGTGPRSKPKKSHKNSKSPKAKRRKAGQKVPADEKTRKAERVVPADEEKADSTERGPLKMRLREKGEQALKLLKHASGNENFSVGGRDEEDSRERGRETGKGGKGGPMKELSREHDLKENGSQEKDFNRRGSGEEDEEPSKAKQDSALSQINEAYQKKKKEKDGTSEESSLLLGGEKQAHKVDSPIGASPGSEELPLGSSFDSHRPPGGPAGVADGGQPLEAANSAQVSSELSADPQSAGHGDTLQEPAESRPVRNHESGEESFSSSPETSTLRDSSTDGVSRPGDGTTREVSGTSSGSEKRAERGKKSSMTVSPSEFLNTDASPGSSMKNTAGVSPPAAAKDSAEVDSLTASMEQNSRSSEHVPPGSLPSAEPPRGKKKKAQNGASKPPRRPDGGEKKAAGAIRPGSSRESPPGETKVAGDLPPSKPRPVPDDSKEEESSGPALGAAGRPSRKPAEAGSDGPSRTTAAPQKGAGSAHSEEPHDRTQMSSTRPGGGGTKDGSKSTIVVSSTPKPSFLNKLRNFFSKKDTKE